MRRDATGKQLHQKRTRALLIACLLTIAAATLMGCAGAEKRPAHKQLPSRKQQVEREVIRPAEQKAPEAARPARLASDRLVASGQALLAEGAADRAATQFREAINIDPKNGPAYYYLALAQKELNEPDIALGLLDKAYALLSYDPEWVSRIDAMRAELGAEPVQPTEPSPIDEAF